MYLSIKQGAIFVADSHYNQKNKQFLLFLKKLENKEIKTTQLFLMGDMIDFISGESKYFIKINKKIIDLINKISQTVEVFYLEGNHDYNLKNLFPKVKVFKRQQQPVDFLFENKTVALAHGDIFTPWHYNLYCKVIRNSFLLKFLNMIDFSNIISKRIYNFLLKKNICEKISDFESFAKKRIKNYSANIVIEGHFHQGKTFKNKEQYYINIPSLCCSKQYMGFDGEFKGIDL